MTIVNRTGFVSDTKILNDKGVDILPDLGCERIEIIIDGQNSFVKVNIICSNVTFKIESMQDSKTDTKEEG